MRIEDVDGPRVVAGATKKILSALDAYQLHWDGPVLYQSTRGRRYAEALAELWEAQRVFACDCSRRQIRETAASRGAGHVYPGTCRRKALSGDGRSIRLRSEGARARFEDRIQGPQAQDLEREVGDFVVRRADGIFAYQLAVVIDDADQGVTDVVRGYDILDSTGRQIHLQRLLGLPTPGYAHLPIAVDSKGRKLSKMSGAGPIPLDSAGPTLVRGLDFLGQQPPAELARAEPAEIVAWAVTHWQEASIPARSNVLASKHA